jgi:demethylmenaquinone methyltransferase/2-methoxy-6-polyprenyl-1,4-benzoquinol methylase
MVMMSDILQQQIDYYRARATEYNEWWYRQERYDRGEIANQQWFSEITQLQQALSAIPPQAHILELACGTGIWTRELVKIGNKVTAVDASPEMIAINKIEVASDKVDYIESDIFNWQSPTQYDMIFFSFWLSHVPPDRLASFLGHISTMIKPNGHLFIIDSRRVPESTANNHVLPDEGVILQRKLNDGRVFEIVKVFYQPDDLQAQLSLVGFDATITTTDNFFITAHGRFRAS